MRKTIHADTASAACNRRDDCSRKTHKEIEREPGLEGDRPVHNLLKRERKKALKCIRKQRGRKPAKTLQEYKYENKRLKMEVELFHGFGALRIWCR